MAFLITSIEATNLTDVHIGAEHAWKSGSQGVELRLDCFVDDPAKLAAYLGDRRERMWILTCRCQREGGRSVRTPAERGAFLASACRGNDAYIDFEFEDWPESGKLREAVNPALGDTGSRSLRLILSKHDFDEIPQRLEQQIDAMLAINGTAAAKVAYSAERITDAFPVLDLMVRYGGKVTAVCMEEEGSWSRVLSAKLGAFCTYCSAAPGVGTASGQLSLQAMTELYRWSEIDASTRVYGVVGFPVAHSLSPGLFNEWFADHRINAVYLPFLVAPDRECLAHFLEGCLARSWLDLGGVSVTVPHKVAACRWVGSGADRLSQSIGAVNTLVFSEGRRRGYNTDCFAATASLVDALGGSAAELAKLPVDVLGCGGAARAVVGGLRQHGSRVTVYGRSQSKAAAVARDFDCQVGSWEDRTRRNGAVVINCTSVGMWPNVEASPMPVAALDGCRLVYDLVYNPRETKLLQQAAGVGALTLGGLDMFLRQAAIQFELWSGAKPDLNRGRLVMERLLRKTEDRRP